MPEYGFGAIPSKPDNRDYLISSVTPVRADFPDDYRLSPLAQVRDQFSSSMCVAFSLAVMKRYQERQEGNYSDYSPAFIYTNRLDTDWQGEGMMAREALQALVASGVCRNELFPAIGNYPDLKKMKRIGMYADAIPQAIETYVQVTTPDEVKTALVDLNSPVLVIVPVFTDWYKYKGDRLTTGGTVEGYHAMLIVGWQPGEYLVQNSWGTGWGEAGFGWLPMDYPIAEMWAVTDKQAKKPARRIELIIGDKVAHIDGEAVALDVPAKIEQGRTLVPLRFIGEAFGAEVTWDEASTTVTINGVGRRGNG